jgi:glucose dehydrogenase
MTSSNDPYTPSSFRDRAQMGIRSWGSWLPPFLRVAVITVAACLPSASQIKNQPDDGQWIMPAKNYASTRFSTLTDINTDNVKNLKLAWTFSTGLTRGHEAAPLVVNNTMYIVTPWPNILYALDLTKPGSPMKWKYSPQPAAASQGVACCDVVNRGAA